ncbi:MAG TPA: sigma factor, partial [Ilumatobacter sp.]|nr:sigma factor [Ilumatobacter sp.]
MEPSGGDAAPPNLAAPPGVSPAMSAVTAPATADVAEHVSHFDALFADHYARLVRALTLVAGDREVAADAVQEAFVRAHLRWRKIGRYDDPIGWVRRVAIN